MAGITAKIVVLPGDGVGPDVVRQARNVLETIAEKFDHDFQFQELLIGGAAYDAHGVPLRDEDVAVARDAEAILLGAVGGPAWDHLEPEQRPERGLLKIRKELGLYANLRPVSVMPSLANASPLKPEFLNGVDLLVVRELTGGLYFGQPSKQWQDDEGRVAVDTLIYHEHEIRRVVELAFQLAENRRQHVASVDKANVLQSSRLWRAIVEEVAAGYPDIVWEHVLVDSMAMHLVRAPARFDVIVTENMFGDILTDEASVLSGSIGLLPSASLGAARTDGAKRTPGLYEPIHGSAPDIAGRNIANPAGAILSAALLLRYSLGLHSEASLIERSVRETIDAGVRTVDIADRGNAPAGTDAFGEAVVHRIRTLAG